MNIDEELKNARNEAYSAASSAAYSAASSAVYSAAYSAASSAEHSETQTGYSAYWSRESLDDYSEEEQLEQVRIIKEML